ncbi:hypothetical protein ACIPY3_10710 [Paenarthrobacter sp. NPDC089714]|uniref:hypothetical protein n=1 Tax=Paenarthrobacter sp. NPDC089714 TaxID=3364377 RepID=UPI003825B3B5
MESQGMHADGAAERESKYPIKHLASSYDRGVQIAAARVRIITDRGLGKRTPDWILQLAAEKLAGDY